MTKFTNLDKKHEEFYNIESEKYDEIRYDSAEGKFFINLEVKILTKLLKNFENAKLLDVPAGTGRMTIPLAEIGLDVTGADISEEMLNQADKKAKNKNIKNIKFEHANGRDLHFDSNSFDVVTSFKFFHLIPNTEKPEFIKEMLRVVKPGGKLIVEFNSPYYGFFLAFYRYYIRKHTGMAKQCVFPHQLQQHFNGLKIHSVTGVKLPFSGILSKIVGSKIITSLNLRAGTIPVVKYLCYVILVEVENTAI
ncbi:MAG: methyltransferase domain-containing protein [Bacteroidetes bacterium]|nr:methyltransferase domain-containing protein [Bacteroidota bacterium]